MSIILCSEILSQRWPGRWSNKFPCTIRQKEEYGKCTLNPQVALTLKKSWREKKERKGISPWVRKEDEWVSIARLFFGLFQSSCFAEESKGDGGIHINMRVLGQQRDSLTRQEEWESIPQEMKIGPCSQLNEISWNASAAIMVQSAKSACNFIVSFLCIISLLVYGTFWSFCL